MGRLATSISGKTFEQAIERVKLAESLGYESVWVSQVSEHEATIDAAVYATATKRMGIGTGVLPIYPRTPAVMAQTAATLDDLSGGRFILGLGTSHKITIEAWHGMELTKPLAHMREYVSAVRAILRGEPYFGEIYKTVFQFTGFKPLRPGLPIYISCLSPKMCELAGEVADGAVLWMTAPNYIRDVIVPHIEKGRAAAGKTLDGFEIVAAVPISLTENKDEGRNAFRRVSAVYWSLPFYRAAIEGAGYGAALKTFDDEGPFSIPDNVVDDFAGIGDAQDCKRAIEAYRAAGTTLPNAGSLPAHEGFAGLEETLKAAIG
jgi:alkanesulfonate monooxygenase SsuD/methylene tetrahydromethanopterin reductase-like flavin-dependent oxidoreductase (luciferase family)